MARSPFQRILGVAGTLAVLAILGFVILPAAVVTVAAFNDKAILAFPPEIWSWRWFAKALAYEDFRSGFRNGLLVAAWASSIALLVGTTFALALDRYSFPLKRTIEAVLLSSLVVPHFTIGLGFLILAAQIGWARGFGVVVASDEEPGLSSHGDAPELALRDIIIHAQPPIGEEAPECPLLAHDVAERGAEQAAGVLHLGVLGLGPGEEVVEQRPEPLIAQGLALMKAHLERDAD